MIKATVLIDNLAWKKKIKNPQRFINTEIKKMQKLPFCRNKKQEFTILLTRKNKIKKLNKDFRNKNRITDVLSFPIKGHIGNKNYIGDIAICYEVINTRSLLTNFKKELNKMWVHGYLHLIGYDHIKNKDYNKMINKENLILRHLNKKIESKI